MIGCEPGRLMMNTFDDPYCKRRSPREKPISPRMIVDMTRDKCIKQGRWSFKGKCDMDINDRRKLNEIELKIYKDDRCQYKDERASYAKGKDKLEYGLFKCAKHPLIPGKYAMLEPIRGGGDLVAVLILCCCCCACVIVICACMPKGDGGSGDHHHEVHEEVVIVEEHHSDRSHHSSRSRSSRSHHSSERRSHHSEEERRSYHEEEERRSYHSDHS